MKSNRKAKSSSKPFLSLAALAPVGNTTLQKLITLLNQQYTHAPLKPDYTVGPLVPDLDALAANINDNWQPRLKKLYTSGDIDPSWTLQNVADDIDERIAGK